jgi:RNA polymerase sigma-70 factor, ECF subfamily
LREVRDCDGELLCRIAVRDEDAFAALYRRYARPVFALALRILRDRGRAEDAVQETFAAVWRSARTYRPERGPGAPWLYAIARNAVVDCARGRRDTVIEPPDQVSPELGLVEVAEASWLAFRVHAAVAGLPERERAVLELAYWGGRSQSEIARFLGIPLGTVKTRTRRGLARLAATLDGQL